MKKISDRFLLGVLSGLGANIPKLVIARTAKKLKLVEIDGPEKAAGMLVPPHSLILPAGKIVGYLADSVIAGMLGIVMVYLLSITGKDKAVWKGALAGQSMWVGLYGVLASFGATKVQPVSPTTVLSEFLAHTAYGAAAAALAVTLGAKEIFTGKIPLSASNQTGSQEHSLKVARFLPRTDQRYTYAGLDNKARKWSRKDAG